MPPTPTRVNQPPVVAPIQLEIVEDTPRSISLLESVSDADSTSLTITSLIPGSNGSLTVQEPGSVLYTPGPGFVGSDSFSFVVTDGEAYVTGTVTITVTAANHAPTFTTPAPEGSITVDTEFTFLITANDSDPEDEMVIRSVQPLPSWLTLAPISNGLVNLIARPTTGEIGTHTIQLEVVDRAGASNTWEFTLTVAAPDNAGTDGTVSGATDTGSTAPITNTNPIP